MKAYWIVYISTLLSYLIFSISWISITHTMPALPKIIGTSVCVMVVVVTSGITSKRITDKIWIAICLIPLSFFIWITVVDASIGLWFHRDITYMSVNTWPDSWVVQIVQNGKSYLGFKAIGILVTSGLLYYIK